jgi:transcriptional regulator SbtR-like protein
MLPWWFFRRHLGIFASIDAPRAAFAAEMRRNGDGSDRPDWAHFLPDREQLAGQMGQESAPVGALRQWLRAIVQLVSTKKGMLAALALAADGRSDLYAYSSERLTKAIGTLLQRAVAAGQIRADITPEDLLRALIGLCYSYDRPDWQEPVTRLIDVFIDGLVVHR